MDFQFHLSQFFVTTQRTAVDMFLNVSEQVLGKERSATGKKNHFLINLLSLGNAEFGFLGKSGLKCLVEGAEYIQGVFCPEFIQTFEGKGQRAVLSVLSYRTRCLGQTGLLLADVGSKCACILQPTGQPPGSHVTQEPTAPCQRAEDVLSLAFTLSVEKVGLTLFSRGDGNSLVASPVSAGVSQESSTDPGCPRMTAIYCDRLSSVTAVLMEG